MARQSGKAAFQWAVFVAVLLGLTLPQLARAELTESQLRSVADAERRDRDAARRAGNAGRDSIGRGGRHMRMGRHHHNGGEMHLGAIEIAQGILGLLASAVADKLGRRNDVTGTNLDQLAGGAGGGGAPAATPGQGAGPVDVSGQSHAALDSAALGAAAQEAASKQGKVAGVDLNDPDTKKALEQIQDQYGYAPEQFVAKLQEGTTVADLFRNAPRNALTEDQLKAALKASRMGALDAASASPSLALSPGGQGADAGASVGGTPGTAAEPANTAPDSAATGGGSQLRDAIARGLADRGDLDVSPDVKAALAARDAAERSARNPRKPEEEMDLFEVVHEKYRERENNLRWGEPLKAAGV